MMLENAYYSVISPEGCSVILWKTASCAEGGCGPAHEREGPATSKIMDAIVPEPEGGAHMDRPRRPPLSRRRLSPASANCLGARRKSLSTGAMSDFACSVRPTSSHSFRCRGRRVTEKTDRERGKPDEQRRSVWEEAHDLIRRLEGTTVQRLAIETGDFKVEIGPGASAAAAQVQVGPGGAPAAGVSAAQLPPPSIGPRLSRRWLARSIAHPSRAQRHLLKRQTLSTRATPSPSWKR